MDTKEIILEQGKKINDIEDTQRLHAQQIRELQQNYQKLEHTIVQENRETRMIFQSTMDKQWDLIKSRDTANENENKRKLELEKTKFERRTEVVLKLLGAGGLVYLCVQSIIDMLLK